MGKLEKWVVLGVLGLIVGVLVVSLTVDDPLKKSDIVMASGSSDPSAVATPAATSASSEAAPRESPPSALLHSSVVTSPPATATAPSESAPAAAMPAGSILKTGDGLEPSYMSDMRFYTWKSGDTFPVLAERFYGDVARLATLRRVNEGITDVQPGDRILVPVFDLDSQAPAPGGAIPSPAPLAGQPASLEKTPKAAAAEASALSGPRVHVVKEGESLWKIAKLELGAGTRWKEIYDANRDQLSSPEAVHVGLKLRVP